jgi:hypothetical protein
MHRTIYFLVLFFVAAFAAPNPPSHHDDNPRPPTEVPQRQSHQVGDIVGVTGKEYDETMTGVGHSLSLVPIGIILISIAERC